MTPEQYTSFVFGIATTLMLGGILFVAIGLKGDFKDSDVPGRFTSVGITFFVLGILLFGISPLPGILK